MLQPYTTAPWAIPPLDLQNWYIQLTEEKIAREKHWEKQNEIAGSNVPLDYIQD